MRRAPIIAAAMLFVPACTRTVCQPSEAQANGLPVLATARQVHSLTPEQASRGFPIRLRGVVTFYDPYQEGHKALFIADRTGGIFVAPGDGPILPIHAGSLVEVSGVTDPGGFAPIISKSAIRVLGGSKPLPAARTVTFQHLLTGFEDGQWVALRGIVRSVEFDGMHVVLSVATADGTLTATTDKEEKANYSALVDSEITIRGVAAPLVNPKRQMMGVRLLFPGLETITIEAHPPSNPFSLPTLSLRSLLQYPLRPATSHRIHVRGRVTLSWPGQRVCIVDDTDGLCIQTVDRTPLKEGDLIDVVGFLGREDYIPIIAAATLRRVEGGGPVPPTPISGANAVDTHYIGELVRIGGKLVGRNRGLGSPTLLLSSGGIVFPAVLPAEAIGNEKQFESRWTDGSWVEVTGVFAGKVDEHQTIRQEGISRLESFQILLRSSGDVHVISSPLWWSFEHTLEVLGLAGLAIVSILGWVAILRRQVQRQTDIIRLSEERFRHMAEHDGLTGLPVRTVLLQRLDLELNEMKYKSSSLALLMIDVDCFKHLNDTLGHAAGDQVLCTVGSRLQAALRSTDTIARMGGDEFTVLLTGLQHPDDAQKIASDLVSRVSAPIIVDGNTVEVTVSVGVATYPETGADIKTLLQNSDSALYQAKARGRNCYQIYSSRAPLRELGAACRVAY